MAILLLLIGFLGFVVANMQVQQIRFSIVKAILFFSLAILFTTEILSLFNSLNYLSLVVVWGFIAIVLLVFIIKRKLYHSFSEFKSKFKASLKSLNKLEKFLVVFVVFILVGVFLQGIIYPPNNWDALAYHMARIVHWVQNENLSHYRTPVFPQLNSPPFSEQFILTLNLLVGSDYLSNSVSLFYFFSTAIGVSLVSKSLNINRLGQLLSFFVMLCIPEAILLASSTHTELVLSFFMVMSIYFMIKTLRNQDVYSFMFLGISLGLSVATKSIAYVYLSSFVIIWLVLFFYKILSKKIKFNGYNYALTIVLFAAINVGHYTRNYQLTSNVLGTNASINNIYLNEDYSVASLFSNVLRNVTNQFGVPKVAPVSLAITEKIHHLLGIDINNPKNSYADFSIDPLATHENNGANPLYAFLMLLSSVVMILYFRKIDKLLLIFWIAIIFSFFIFSFYLKWQPFVKTHVPFFIFYSIVLAYFLTKIIDLKVLFYGVVTGMVIHAVTILLFNYSRPFITWEPFTSGIKVTDGRYKKNFSRFSRYHKDYEVVKDIIDLKEFKNIGLMMGSYDMEYQLFNDVYRKEINSIHINSCRISESLSVAGSVDCIVSTKGEKQLLYNGETYTNVTPFNDGYLFLFLKH